VSRGAALWRWFRPRQRPADGRRGPKQYLVLRGRCVLDHALAALLGHPAIRGAVVAVAADDLRWRDCEHAREPRVRWVTGGAERCHSS